MHNTCIHTSTFPILLSFCQRLRNQIFQKQNYTINLSFLVFNVIRKSFVRPSSLLKQEENFSETFNKISRLFLFVKDLVKVLGSETASSLAHIVLLWPTDDSTSLNTSRRTGMCATLVC